MTKYKELKLKLSDLTSIIQNVVVLITLVKNCLNINCQNFKSRNSNRLNPICHVTVIFNILLKTTI